MKQLTAFITILILMASCNTSKDVVTGGLFQKRKYNKGYHVSVPAKKQSVKATSAIIVENDSTVEAAAPITNIVNLPADTSHFNEKVFAVATPMIEKIAGEKVAMSMQQVKNDPLTAEIFELIVKVVPEAKVESDISFDEILDGGTPTVGFAAFVLMLASLGIIISGAIASSSPRDKGAYAIFTGVILLFIAFIIALVSVIASLSDGYPEDNVLGFIAMFASLLAMVVLAAI